jgi:Bacterial Ig-like domain (group 3)
MAIRSALAAAGNCVAVACVLLAAGVGGSTAAAVVPAAASAPATWDKSMQPPGVTGVGVKYSDVQRVSCPSAGNCTAVGNFSAPGGGPNTPFAISEKGGKWQHAQLLLNRAANDTARYLNLVVSCPSAGNCVGGGERLDGKNATVFVVDQKNGTWGPPQTIVGSLSTASYPSAISCPKAGGCTIGGLYQVMGQNEGWVADEKPDGSWGPLMQPLSSQVNAGGSGAINEVSCGAPGYCVAVGYYTDSSDVSHGYIAQERNHAWDAPFVLPGNPASNLGAVSCDAPGDCEVGGNLHLGDAFVVREKAFTWSGITALPGLKQLNAGKNAELHSISCRTKGNCSAGGFYSDAKKHGQGFVVSEKNGKWAKVIEVPGLGALNTLPFATVDSVSCASPGNCAAGGIYYVTGEFPHAFLVSELNGSWHGAQVPRGVAAPSAKSIAGVESVSCGAVGSCAAVGFYYNAGAAADRGWIARGSVRQPTSAALALSTASVRFGHEQGLKVTAKVIPGYAGPATGQVTVYAGSKAVCALTLKNGAGTCSPAAKRLAIGKYQLVARYTGNVTFAPSASAAKQLTVTK